MKSYLYQLKEFFKEIHENVRAKIAQGHDLTTGQVLKELQNKEYNMKLLHLMEASLKMKYVPSQ